jgi:Uma2 family endonuclease
MSAPDREQVSSACYIGQVMARTAVLPDRIRPLRRVEYDVLVDQGVFDDARVELLLGSLVEVTPQGPLHADIVRRLTECFAGQLPATVQLRIQLPLAVSDDSEPEPDVAIVPADDYTAAHPQRALLVIEVAHSSVQKDRGIKAALYATAGIPEFWLVNLVDRIVEVHRQPREGRYEVIERVVAGQTLAPAAFPGIQFPADIVVR